MYIMYSELKQSRIGSSIIVYIGMSLLYYIIDWNLTLLMYLITLYLGVVTVYKIYMC